MSNTVSDLCLVFDKRQEDVGLAGSRRTRRTRRTSSPQRLHRGPHPTTTRSSPRVVRSPPASAPLRARLGAAPPCARRATRTAAPRAEAVYCSAARASRLRLRVAPGSGQPAAPSALRGGRTLRLRCLPLAALRIHSLRSGHGLPGVRHAQVGSVPRGGAHSATAAGLLRFSSRSRVAVGCGIRSRLSLRGLQAPHADARPPRGRERVAHRQRCPRARERAGLRPERHHASQERPEAPDGASGLAQPEV